jgi:hypothetical protein
MWGLTTVMQLEGSVAAQVIYYISNTLLQLFIILFLYAIQVDMVKFFDR